MRLSLHHRIRLVPTFVVLSGLTGCYNYPAVSSLSSSMQKSTTVWQPFVDDFVATCTRRVAYSYVDGDIATQCDPLVDNQKQIADRIRVLDNYFGALAAVATDSNFTFDDGLGAVATSAKQIGAVAGEVDAVQVLATTLANLYGAHLRHAATKRLIDQAPNASTVVAGLQDVFDKVYGLNLTLEANKWHEAMQHASGQLHLMTASASGPPACAASMVWTSPTAALSTAEQLRFERFYNEQCGKIVARQAAIAQFDKAAQQLRASLADLHSNKTKLSDKAVAEAFFTQAKKVVEQAEAVKKAFTPSDTTS